jgi:hypothetical protein
MDMDSTKYNIVEFKCSKCNKLGYFLIENHPSDVINGEICKLVNDYFEDSYESNYNMEPELIEAIFKQVDQEYSDFTNGHLCPDNHKHHWNTNISNVTCLTCHTSEEIWKTYISLEVSEFTHFN